MYSFLPTSSVLDGMKEHGWLPVRATEQRVRNLGRAGFQKHMIRFAREENLEDLTESNATRPEIVLVNSQDRTAACQLHCGIFRVVCMNGLIVADSTFERIRIRHLDFNPDSVIQGSFAIMKAVPEIMNRVQLFQDRVLTEDERLSLATGAAAYRWETPDKAPVNPAMLLKPRRSSDDAKNLWVTMNAIQENIIKGGQRDYSRMDGNGHRMNSTRPIKGIDEDIKLNKALWHMAEVLRKG